MPFKTPTGKLLYRVGDVIISINSDNPAKWYGGTWQLLCPGKTLVCIDTSDSDFNTVKKVGGNKYLQSHNHSASSGYVSNDHTHYLSLITSWSGEHNHRLPHTQNATRGTATYGFTSHSASTGTTTSFDSGSHSHTVSGNTGGISSNHTHAITLSSAGAGNTQNLQPYMVVYMWVRTS